MARTARRREDRGAAAVEFALIVPIVVLLLFGTLTTGLVYNDHVSITNAAREGARYGAVADATNGTTWASAVQTRVKQVYFNAAGATPTDNQICVKLVDSAGNALATDGGTSCGTQPTLPTMAAGTCAVVVWMRKPDTIRLAVAPDLHLHIGADSVDYYGRTLGTSCTAS